MGAVQFLLFEGAVVRSDPVAKIPAGVGQIGRFAGAHRHLERLGLRLGQRGPHFPRGVDRISALGLAHLRGKRHRRARGKRQIGNVSGGAMVKNLEHCEQLEVLRGQAPRAVCRAPPGAFIILVQRRGLLMGFAAPAGIAKGQLRIFPASAKGPTKRATNPFDIQ